MHTTNKIIKPNNPNFANYTNKKLKKIKKDFLKYNVYDNITYLLQPKRKKIKSDMFKIPKMSEFNLLLTIDYNVSQLKKICKHYKLKVGGLKKVLIFRVYNYLKYSYYSIKIQKIVKGNIIRKINKLKGPALFNKKLCVNEVDFLTLEPIKNTTYADFFSFKDTDDFIYGFDICSLWNLYIVQDKNARKTKMKSRVMNPYNRKQFPSKLIRRLKKVIKMQKSINYPANIKLDDDTQELPDQKKIELECIRLFQKIDEKGHVTNISWFMDLTPQKILNVDEYSEEFFKIIDDIDNKILNNESIEVIASQYNLTLEIIEDYYPYDKEFELIYSKKSNPDQINLIDNNDHYLLFKISKVEEKLPNINSEKFRQEISLSLKNQFKFEYNKKLIEDIQNKNIKYNDLKSFNKSSKIQNIKISSIRDNNKFSIDSIKLIYSLPEKSFILINDDEKKIYLAFIKQIVNENKITEDEIKNYSFKSNSEIRSTLYSSYDIYLSKKYEIKVFQSTIERLKNNFR